MYKVCIWENIASPHQSAFFSALREDPRVDLEVRYFETFHEERRKLGWQESVSLPENERYVVPDVGEALKTLPDWKERIHLIPGLSYPFTQALLSTLMEAKVKWIHWSERSGIGLARKLGYRVWFFELLQPFVAKWIKKSYAQKINTDALGVFAQGYLAKKDFVDWGTEEQKIEYLFYTIEQINKTKIVDDQDTNEKTFMYVGSLDERKGIVQLLKAFKQLNHQNKWRLVLVGADRSHGKYEKLVQKLGMEESVVFTGSKPIEEIGSYMGAADVFVLPTLFDGWGAVLNEAAALGKPIISTDQCGAAYHLLENGKNGFRVRAGDIKALSGAMQFYAEHPKEIEKHGRHSLALYEASFTPQANVERFISALDKWTQKEMLS